MKEKTLQNLAKTFDVRTLEAYIIATVPHIFDKPELLMERPVVDIHWNDKKYTVEAKPYVFPFSITTELFINMYEIFGDSAGEELFNLTADSICKALDSRYHLLKKQNQLMCPFIPIQLFKAINSTTFNPEIGFKTLYGTIVEQQPNKQ